MDILISAAPIDFNESQNSPKNEFKTSVPDRFIKQFHLLSISIGKHRDCGSYPECIHKVTSARPANAVLGMWVSLAAKGTLGLRKAFGSFGLSKEQIIFFIFMMGHLEFKKRNFLFFFQFFGLRVGAINFQ